MFLLVPAYPGCPRQTAVKWLLYFLLLFFFTLVLSSQEMKKLLYAIQKVKKNQQLLYCYMNEYYYSAVQSKKLQGHWTTEKNKTNDSVTQDKNGSQTVGDETSG